mgnify:FL=1|tara:strand:- start:5220 stop:5945 length:726 start_codon:yes stop_codon:yes gene_type:complete
MTDQSIFNNDEPSTPAEASQSGNEQASAADQLLGAIVNSEGKQKYGTVEDALKATAAAQEHIRRLEEENTSFRQKVEESTTLQAVLDAVKPREVSEPAPAVPTSSIGEDDVAQLLEGMLNKRETAATAKSNVSKVTSAFVEKHGVEAEAKYYESAAALGFTNGEINELAARNPAAVFKMLGIDDKPAAVANPLRSSVGAGSLSDNKPQQPTFNPFQGGTSPSVEAFRKSKAATNERLGLDN